MKTPGIWTLKRLLEHTATNSQSSNGRDWYPCRGQLAIGWRARFKAAWIVFTGRADAVIWPDGQ